MTDSNAAAKEELRRHMRAARDRFADRAAASVDVCRRLAQQPQLRSARTVHSFLPVGSEVDVLPLLCELLDGGVRIAVPVMVEKRRMVHSWVSGFSRDDWQPAPFGTRAPRRLQLLESAEIAALDLVLVPLLAFDDHLRRLGYGGGYYDRFLPTTGAYRLGAAFQLQQVPRVPTSEHDASLDAVVTEASLFQCS
jgi:5-formyltetrahydrofolate cyclo-ligase